MNKIYATILLITFLSLLINNANAQVGTPAFFNAVPTTGANGFPLNTISSNKVQWIYAPNAFTSDGTSAGIVLGAGNNISKFYIRIQTANANTIYQPEFVISMKQEGTANAFSNSTYLTGLTTVFSSNAFQFTGITTGSWYGITLTTPFPYNPSQSLIVEVKSNLAVTGGNSVNSITTTGLNQRIHGGYASATGTAGIGLTPIGFDVVPGGPCTNPPTPGSVTSNNNPVCSGSNFSLSLTGGTIGTGQTYQWESSTNNVTFTPITGATNSSLVTSQTTLTYYRVAVTCGVTIRSSSLLVSTPPLVSGNFTINNGIPTGGSNFQTFADAVNHIRCGISSPVVFNVAPGSNFTEQLIIPAIGGVSATNTITFNGNDATISFNSTITTERAGIKLDGADFVTIRNFVITGTGTATTDFNFGIHLLNGADNNTIKGCTINLTIASTSLNFAGIAISGTASSATTTGSNSDYNLIDSNNVIGGYYGITVNGATGALATGNIIRRNTFQDWYLYGLYINLTDSTIIEKNTVNRMTRSAGVTTFNGIFVTGQTERVQVSKNRIHDPFAGLTTSTSAAYGIFFSSADAVAGKENVVSNNLIYNFVGGGIQYGLYNSSSDGVRFYHNTVVLDDANYTGTAVTRGFYQITDATRIEMRNNIITISRGGAGLKHVVYFGTTTSSIVSNNNVLFINSSAGTNAIGFYSTGFTTLANWQTANNNAYDQGSVSVDPLYTNPGGGEYKPSNPQVNNIGANVGITTDILDSARLAASPDPGAYEFSIGGCTNPPNPGTTVSSVSSACQGAPFTLNLDGNSVGDGQTYQWQVSSNNTTWINIGTASTSTAFTTSQTSGTYYRAQVTCRTGTPVFSASVLVTSPALVSGTYTINSGIPTGGTNFQTFADAVNFMRCGINGPIVFNVAPGSSFSEQVVIPAIKGASAVNQVIFNGNDAAISFTSTNTDSRAAIRLDGADHVTIRNFVITGTGTATTDFNFGIQLLGGADSNTLKGNTINLTIASTSTNFTGISISGSANSATTTGSNSDYNLIDSNNVTGGYYGITINGATGALATGNIIRRNTFQDWYLYGLYINLTDSTIIEKNTVNRLTRSTGVTTFNGIFVTGQTERVQVRKNRIHDPFAGLTTSTSAAYGIFFSSADAVAGKENVVSNNLIYNFVGGGIQYGLYNSTSDSVRFYHNTVVLDDANYAGTAATRGFYQVTQATGVEVRNNIITVARGGAGAQHNLYFGTITSTIASNNNLLYNTSTAAASGIGFYSTNFVTLANWQTANTNAYDQQSRSVDPMFLNPGGTEFVPTSSLADNIGAPVGITTDIRDSLRSVTAPDAGAYEFSSLTAGINMSGVALVTPQRQASGCYSSSETVTVRIRNSSTSVISFSVNPVTVTVNVTGAVTQTLSAVVNSGTLASDSGINVVMTTTLNMSAPGAYTFNARTAVAGDVNTENDAIIPVIRTKQTLTTGSASGPSGFCVTLPVNTTLSATGVNGNTSLQWLQSINAGSGYTAINGATTVPYTVAASPTQTMYYKLVATCATNTDTSSVVTVAYNNPQVTGTTPGGRCGSGTVTLGAAGSNGTTLEWYAAATGGAPLVTGPTFTTPVLNTNTTYYVAANILGGSGVASPLLVTEIDIGGSDQLEIQNVSGSPVDVTGWKVAVSNSYADINSVNAIIQTLSGVMNPGETKTWTDQSAAPNYWGNNILFNPGGFPGFAGWAAILDNNNNLVDIVFLNWPSANIQAANIPIGTANITIGTQWTGNGIDQPTVTPPESISRKGTSDNNSLSDFIIQAFSIGTTNPGMSLPFSGFGCSSSRTPVLAKTDDCPLPVTLLNFKGEKQGTINKLDWTTVTELNNAGFELQRSADGINFSQLSYLPSKAANGISNAAITYSFDDVRPFAGNSYYRLKQIDKDGKENLSIVILIKTDRTNVTSITSIYPNPAKESLNLIIHSPTAEKLSLVITDMSGKQVMQQATQLVPGDNQLQLPVSKLAAGTYIIKSMCSNGCESAATKFVKQ